MQERVQKLIAEDAKKNPQLGSALEAKKDTTFKTPEGFSNVVGVGANPVMEAMAEQTEIARQQLAELQKLNAKATDTQTDFTKDSK
jgi:phosphoglycolate phosphatase-like HAD superfamily hydrolase